MSTTDLTIHTLHQQGAIDDLAATKAGLILLGWSPDEAISTVNRLTTRSVATTARPGMPTMTSVRTRTTPTTRGGIYQAWSDDDKARLTEAYTNGTPVGVIADQLGRKLTAVQGQIANLRLRRGVPAEQQPTPAPLSAVAQMVATVHGEQVAS